MPWIDPLEIFEPILVTVASSLYFIYHYSLWRRYCNAPLTTNIGQNNMARALWCETVIRERRDLLAIQTIRNSMMASSLLASTSLSLSAVVAAYVVQSVGPDGEDGIDWLGCSFIKPIHKFFGVTLFFTFSFYCFIQCVRSSAHASFMISMAPNPQHPEFVWDPKRVIERGANFHTIATRLFYFAFLLMVWIFGPVPFVICTFALTGHLWYLDKVDCNFIYQHAIDSSRTSLKLEPGTGAINKN